MSPEPDPRLLNPSRWSPELTRRHPLAEEFENSFEISLEQSRQVDCVYVLCVCVRACVRACVHISGVHVCVKA